MNKKLLYIISAAIAVVLIVFVLIFWLVPKNNKNFKIVSMKNSAGEQITLVGKTVDVNIEVPTGKKVNLNNVSITSQTGLTKVSGLVLPVGVTKSVQVVMASGKTQVCVSDTDAAQLSAACNDLNEIILPCPGSKQNFTCTKISDTLFEVSGLSHSIIGDFVDCSGHGTRSAGVCACDAGYYGANCDTKGCKGDTDCDAGYTCDTTKGFCKEKICATSCTYLNGTGTCSKGTCKLLSCATNWGNCDSNDSNGCETNLQTSATNCGVCGLACASGSVCTAGVCAAATKGLGVDCTSNSDCTGGHCLQSQTTKKCGSAASCPTCQVINFVGTSCTNAIDSTDPKTDCTAGNTCISGVCAPTAKALGTACTANSDCTSGNCVQAQSGKVCASVSSCPVCQVVNSGGTGCVNASASTDPKSDCTQQSVLTCGNTGSCNGSGACNKYPVGTVCSNATCSGNIFTGQNTCNSSAICTAPSPISCDDNSNECDPGTCDTTLGCTHTPVTDGTGCNGGAGTCQSGVCNTPQP